MDAYRTGRGSVRMRAKAEITEIKNRTVIVVSEIPYQTSVGSISSRITELVNNRELDGIADVNDESSGDHTRLVITLKRDANANVVLNNLYKLTPMQTSFGVNMVALHDGVPRTMNLRDVLAAYIDHQIEVITRRSEFRLGNARRRAHILEGRIKALDVIDAIIALIRASENRDAAKLGLMAEPFSFTEEQAVDILDMRLAQLTRLSRIELEQELEQLRVTIADLEAILADDGRKRAVIRDELIEIRAQHATPRLATITHDPGEISIEDLVDDKELVVVMTRAGYIKTVEAEAFKAQQRGGRGRSGASLKEADLVARIIHTSAHAYLLFFSNKGKVYRLRAHEIPERDRTAKGIPIVNLIPLEPDERIQAVIDTRDYETNRYLFFATKKGQVKKTLFTEYDKSRREGFIAIKLNDDDELVKVVNTNGSDDVFMVSRSGMTIRFNEDEVRAMGRDAAGVRGMKLRAGDEVVSCDVARDDSAILIVTDAGYGKRTQLDKFTRQGRGGQGVKGIRLTASRGYVVAAFMVGLDDEVMITTSGGVTIRTEARQITSQGRDATGVRLITLDEGQVVAAAAPIIGADDD
jgi:DNA gyrase subunit A